MIQALCSQRNQFKAQSDGAGGGGQKVRAGLEGGRGREASVREGEAGANGGVSQLEGEAPGVSRQVPSPGGPEGAEAEQSSEEASHTTRHCCPREAKEMAAQCLRVGAS